MIVAVSSDHQHINYATASIPDTSKVCSGRGRSYCLIHRRYFETSWCPDCSRAGFIRR
ncbi:hypothetical protein K492DRAFT_140910 [Lichtheimia hyalospora FSU 10163]|nr:hypothetical protein K492DRAFT_140910 [Lichtheimia hyalospora FSU 10163]